MMAETSTGTSAGFTYLETIGAWGNVGRGFAHPVDVAVDERRDRIYVLNRSTAWEAPHGRAVRATAVDWNHDVLAEFGHLGTDPGQLMMPSAMAVDAGGRVYVADEHTHQVSVFDPDGEFIDRWGAPGDEPGQLNRPSGLAVDGEGMLLVVDHVNARIQRFTPEGAHAGAFGSTGAGPGQFRLPWHVAVASDGAIWVSDWGNDRVQAFSTDGTCLAVIGGEGDPLFRRPSGIAVDGAGYVYVSDWARDRVVVLGPDTSHVATWFGDSELSLWARERMSEFPAMAAARAAAGLFDQERRVWRPAGIAVQRDGRVLVADSGRHRVQVYGAQIPPAAG